MSSILFQDDPVYKMNLADLKLEGNKAFKKKDYYTAVKFYSVVYALSESASLLSVKYFAECIFLGTWQKSSLPRVEEKHSAKKPLC